MLSVSLIGRFVLGLVFGTSCIPKLLSPQEFRLRVADYKLLPDGLAALAAWVISAAELLTALALILGAAMPIAASVSALLLIAFSSGVAANLIRGRRVDCGCGLATRLLSWRVVLRNAVLFALAVVVALFPPGGMTLIAVAWPRPEVGVAPASDVVAGLLDASLLLTALLLIVEGRRIRLKGPGEEVAST
jgi:hypothetical protein